LTLSVSDEGYSMTDFERIWWRLFHDWLCAYLMKVIPETRGVHLICYIRFYYYQLYQFSKAKTPKILITCFIRTLS